MVRIPTHGPPTHPGEMLFEEFLKPLKMTQSELAEELGLKAGQLFGILRVAVTGQTVSPPLFESMEIIGKEIVLKRICNAMIQLQKILEG